MAYHCLPRMIRLTFVFIFVSLSLGHVSTAYAADEAVAAPWTAEEVRLVDRPGELVVRLENGMTAIVKEHHAASVAAVRLYVRAGSIYEGEHLGAGLSHIFEHLLAGGATKNRTEEQSRRLLQKVGGQWNAYTTKDHTCYYITAPAQHVGTALNLVADWVTRPTFPQESFDREWGVVQRELEMGSTDPDRQQWHRFAELRYQVHPAQYPVIGHQAILQKLTRDEILEYYHRMYVPDNCIITVVGDFQAEQMLDAIKKEFSDFSRRSVPTIILPDERPVAAPRQLTQVLPSMRGPARLRIGFASVPLEHPDLYALDTLAAILGHGRSSRLYQTLVEDLQVALSTYAYSDTPSYVDGTFIVGCQVAPENLPAARQAIDEQIQLVRDKLVTPAELERAKKQLMVAHLRDSQTAENIASNMARDLLSTGDPHFSDLYVANLQNVTAGQVRDVARRYLNPQTQLTLTLVAEPLADDQAVASATAEDGNFKKITLDNGLRILLKRKTDVDLVDAQLFVLGGLIEENDENNGQTNLMTELSLKGTPDYTARRIADFFDSVGGSIGTSAGNNSFYYTAQVMPDDLKTAIDIFGQVVLQPTFPQDELDKLRPQILAAIEQVENDWHSQAHRYFRSCFFPNSPYKRVSLGTADSVAALTREQLADYHKNAVVASRAVLAIVGNIDVAQAEKLVREHFAAMPAGQAVNLDAYKNTLNLTEPRRFVEPTNRPGATVYVGFPGTRITDVQDQTRLDVLGAIIGATTSRDWFFERLRGAGLVYYARAGAFTGVLNGYFAATAQCESARVPVVLSVMTELFEKARTGQFDEEQLAGAKGRLISQDALSRQTNADFAMQAALDELYGLGYDWYKGYADRVTAVTLKDVQDTAQRYFGAPPTVTVITSEPELLAEEPKTAAK